MQVLAILLALFLTQSQANIQGVVIDDDTGQPLSGVSVELAKEKATTDSQGRFSISVGERGRFRVVPTKNGYVSVRKNHAIGEPGVLIEIKPETRIQNLELRMAKSAVIRGRVLTGEGQPAFVGNQGNAGIRRFSYNADGQRLLSSISSQRMNDRGEFRFYDLAPGEYYIAIIGSFGAFGTPNQQYYPGVMEESKAIPITVKSGDDINIGVMTVPPRTKGTEVWLQLDESAASLPTNRTSMLIDRSLIVFPETRPSGEMRLPDMAPGKHRMIVTNTGTPGGAKLSYALAEFDVGNENVTVKATVNEGVGLATRILMENESGERIPTSQSMGCQLREMSLFWGASCTSARIMPMTYHLDFRPVAPDTYVVSAKSGERDVLTEGLPVTGDTELEIVLSNHGAIAQGVVHDANGTPVSDATVAVIPNASLRVTGLFYRSGVTDHEGKYEIHGIAPGDYKLYAWPDLPGAAYRNAEFMKEYEERGRAVRFEKAEKVSIELTSLK
jgi:hypothetical protein